MVKRVKKMIFNYRYKKAVKQAIDGQKKTWLKHYVIIFKGRPTAITKQRIKEMIKRRRFKKGTTVADIEKVALFITPSQNK